MAQFSIYENKNIATRNAYPYLIDIQSNLLEALKTTVVIPLSPSTLVGGATISKLCPLVQIKGQHYLAFTQQIAGIDKNLLGQEKGNLLSYRSEIIAALNFLVSGTEAF
jgi:toxin CcdB